MKYHWVNFFSQNYFYYLLHRDICKINIPASSELRKKWYHNIFFYHLNTTLDILIQKTIDWLTKDFYFNLMRHFL